MNGFEAIGPECDKLGARKRVFEKHPMPPDVDGTLFAQQCPSVTRTGKEDIMTRKELASTVNTFIASELEKDTTESLQAKCDPFWNAVQKSGTELWFDTGDYDGAAQAWSAEFSGLTTNNSLLNKEIQKGIYDEVIAKSNAVLSETPVEERVIEIAYILNALHGLRLAKRFNCKVSVELHTALADDVEKSISYAKRYHAVSPSHFIVKVPLTPSGLLATKKIRELGIPVNFTLGFSARQNCLAAMVARPSYANVFLGRIGAYIKNNDLGSGNGAGEKATLASQRVLRRTAEEDGLTTRQIAASMRSGDQVRTLAGVDVHTMPLKVAGEAKGSLDPRDIKDATGEMLSVELRKGVSPDEVRLETFWAVPDEYWEFAKEQRYHPPESPRELVEKAAEAGFPDLFPSFSKQELETIAEDGKIPVHKKWSSRIKEGTLAVDSLLNRAALSAFTTDQRALDDRIQGLI